MAYQNYNPFQPNVYPQNNQYEGSYRGSYDSYDDMSYRRGRSRDEYSRHDQKEEMIMKLEQKLKNARTEEERRTLRECIADLERG